MHGRHEVVVFKEDGVIYPFAAHDQLMMGGHIMVDAHYHEYIEILYCIEGSFYILLDGVGHHFQAGDMVIINSMEVHYIKSLSTDINRYIVVRFKPELLYTTTQTIFEAKYVLPFTMKTSTHQKVFTEEEIHGTGIPKLVMQILSEYNQKKYGFELAIRTSLGEIFLWILRFWHEKGLDLNIGSGLNHDTIERLESVFDYVDLHYAEPISIDDMAKLCSMSYSYFSRFFKKAMNRNFSDYVNLVRISKAEHMLATSELSVTDIALEVGFSTSSYFIEQFKRLKGMTPKKFRSRFSQTVTDNK